METFENIIDESQIELAVADRKHLNMHDIYMNLALMLSLKSTCRRGRAGCVVVRYGRVISTGYNGAPAKFEECIDRDACREKGSVIHMSFQWNESPRDHVVDTEGCFDSIHAEANAFGYCSKHGIKTNDCVVYLTNPPCKSCAQLMVAAGVSKIYYTGKFRNDDGLLYCKTYGVELHKMEEAN